MRLDDALHAARTRYVDVHPRSAVLAERARAVLPGGNTRSVLHIDPFAFRVAKADGAYLHDVDGHVYLDLLGDYSAGLLGHRPQVVLDAVEATLARGWSMGAMAEPEIAFAEAVVSRFGSLEQVRFTNSGTEANLMAVMTARHVTARSRVVVFDGGYHGGLLYFGPAGAPLRAPFDYAVLQYNDIAAVEKEFATHGERIACVLVEPMLGASGCIPGDPAFLATLRRCTHETGSLLIFDEVMTSRLSVGGAQQLLGITPDMTVLGKYLAGGLSFGAFGGRRDVMAHFDPAAGGELAHAGTFNNNVASMAAGVATLTRVLTPEVLTATNERGDRLRTTLDEMFRHHGLPMCVTGAGSLLNVHGTAGPLRSGRDLAGADDRWRELLYFAALDSGYHLARRGFIALSIEVTDEDVDRFVEVVDRWCAHPAG